MKDGNFRSRFVQCRAQGRRHVCANQKRKRKVFRKKRQGQVFSPLPVPVFQEPQKGNYSMAFKTESLHPGCSPSTADGSRGTLLTTSGAEGPGKRKEGWIFFCKTQKRFFPSPASRMDLGGPPPSFQIRKTGGPRRASVFLLAGAGRVFRNGKGPHKAFPCRFGGRSLRPVNGRTDGLAHPKNTRQGCPCTAKVFSLIHHLSGPFLAWPLKAEVGWICARSLTEIGTDPPAQLFPTRFALVEHEL